MAESGPMEQSVDHMLGRTWRVKNPALKSKIRVQKTYKEVNKHMNLSPSLICKVSLTSPQTSSVHHTPSENCFIELETYLSLITFLLPSPASIKSQLILNCKVGIEISTSLIQRQFLIRTRTQQLDCMVTAGPS